PSRRRRHRRGGRPDTGGRMRIFALPDLGEGLQEAEIVAWHVAEGDEVGVDQPLLSVETEKAVVEIPSPRAGRVARLFAAPGDGLRVGDPLVDRADAGEAAAAPRASEPAAEEPERPACGDSGTVVGRVEARGEVSRESPTPIGRRGGVAVRATPAVRALARRLGVDLGVVTPSGPNETLTVRDLERGARPLKPGGPTQPPRRR